MLQVTSEMVRQDREVQRALYPSVEKRTKPFSRPTSPEAIVPRWLGARAWDLLHIRRDPMLKHKSEDEVAARLRPLPRIDIHNGEKPSLEPQIVEQLEQVLDWPKEARFEVLVRSLDLESVGNFISDEESDSPSELALNMLFAVRAKMALDFVFRQEDLSFFPVSPDYLSSQPELRKEVLQTTELFLKTRTGIVARLQMGKESPDQFVITSPAPSPAPSPTLEPAK